MRASGGASSRGCSHSCHTPRMAGYPVRPVFVIGDACVYWITRPGAQLRTRRVMTGQRILPRTFDTPLPIDAVLDELARTLAGHNAAVLVAPPGAGKTTRVPLALLDAPWLERQEDHHAGAAADRGARQRRADGEDAGRARRRDRRLPRPLRLEGLARDPDRGRHRGHLLAADPRRSRTDRRRRRAVRRISRALARCRSGPGAGARRADRPARGSAHPGDVGDARRRAGRQDCSAMRRSSPARAAPFRSRRAISAARPMRRWSGRWRMRSRRRCAPIPARCWRSCRAPPKSAAPRIFSASASTMPAIEIVPLFGALDAAVQDRAIAPAPKGQRKVVLATSIAETSLTIEGVRIVVDSGVARVPRYEPDIGLTRLETVRASRAAVDQRRGRAGRTEPGVCYRLWDEPQTASLAAYTQPEILSADLSSLVLDLAQWGVSDPAHAGVSRSAAGAGAEGGAQPAARTRRARWRRPDHRGRQEPARAGAAAAAGAHDRGFAPARRRRGGRRDRRHPDRARPRRRQRRSRCQARSVPPRPLAARRAARAAWRSAGRRRWRRTEGAAARGRARPPPASCWPSPFPTASRAIAAMAASCSPMAAAPRSSRPRRWRARPISRSPN